MAEISVAIIKAQINIKAHNIKDEKKDNNEEQVVAAEEKMNLLVKSSGRCPSCGFADTLCRNNNIKAPK